MVGWVVAVAALLAVCGCGEVEPVASAAPAPAGEQAQAWDGHPVTVTITGFVDHLRPIPHVVSRPWIPVEAVVDQGSQVEAGTVLARLEVDIAQGWMDDELRGGEEREADAERSALHSAGTAAGLEERIADLRGRLEVNRASEAAARAKDEQVLAIAREELAQAERALDAARREHARIAALADSGAISQRALLDAANRLALAESEVEAPRLALEIQENTTNAITRYRLRLEGAELSHQLAGAEAELAAIREGQGRAGRLDSWDVERRRRRVEELRGIVADPEIIAAADGVVRHQDPAFAVGSKPGSDPFTFVLDATGLVVRARIRDRWRPWLDGAGVRIERSADGQILPGRIIAIAAQPEPAADGTGQEFQVLIEPGGDRSSLLPGESCRCLIDLDLGGGPPLAVIPAWRIADRRHPQVRLADGGVRDLDGLFAGERFLVFSGLEPGERLIEVPGQSTGRLRLSGIVEPRRFHPIRLLTTSHRDGWVLRWMLPDGSPVEAGDEVARLSYAGWGDPADRRFSVEYADLEAEARLIREQGEVAAALGRATAAWRVALVEAQRRAFEVQVLHLESTDPERFSRRAAVVRAANDLHRAEERLGELADPAVADSVSANDAERRRLERDQARYRLLRAELAEVALRRSDNHLVRIEARAAAEDADAELQRLRADYVRERLEGQAKLFRAAFDRRRHNERSSRDRARVDGETLRAPIAGQVFQRPRRDGRLLRVGDTIDVEEPMLIPIGDERKVVLEVPAHRVDELAEGQVLALWIPALDRRPREGRIASITRAVVRSATAEPGDLGLGSRIVPVTVVFTLSRDELLRVPLGTTVHADL